MLYLDYAKPVGNGYILNFFADKEEDIQEVSGGKEFVTKNGTNYGVPLASSTVVITYPDKSKKTFVLNGSGEWEESGEAKAQADYAQNDPTQPDYIKNRLVYGENTGNFGFKVISGELTPDSTMIVEFNGVQYTDTVQTLDLDANMEEGDGEEHELAYYIGNGEYFGAEKRDFPFAYSNSSILSLENEGNVIMMDTKYAKGGVISLDGESYYLKPYFETPMLYAGNLYLISPESEDTGENFVILVNYFNMYDVDTDEQTTPTPAYFTLIIYKNNDINFAISKSTKKLYETYIEIPTVEKNIADLKGNVENLKTQITDGDNALNEKIQAIDTLEKIEVKSSGEVSQYLEPNIFYDFTGDLTKLYIYCTKNNSAKAYEYKGQFKSGATAPTVIFPSDVKMIGSSIEPNKTYQFSILNGIGVVIGV